MAPVRGFDPSNIELVNDPTAISLTFAIAFVSVASLVGLLLLIIACGCCGKNEKQRMALLEEDVEKQNLEMAEEVERRAAAQTRRKSPKSRSRRPASPTRSRSSKRSTRPAAPTPKPVAPTPSYIHMTPVEAAPPKPAVTNAAAPKMPHYFDMDEKPNSTKESKEPSAVEHAPAERGHEYRTLYGIGDPFQASGRGAGLQQSNRGKADLVSVITPGMHGPSKSAYLKSGKPRV